MRTATVFAPATVANVAVGFDVLGFAFGAVGDRVTVTRVRAQDPQRRVTVAPADAGGIPLPVDAARNTASVALLAMLDHVPDDVGFDVKIDKGIPLSSGMGGSAASAVGAVTAANAVIDAPFAKEQLLDFALEGEAAASGARHADNVAPCLYGGLVAALPQPSGVPRIVAIPVPDAVRCVVVRPHVRVDTRAARDNLQATVTLEEFARQSAHLAAFVAACHSGDLAVLRAAMQDLVIGPQRQDAIPGFTEVHRAALDAGAIGCAIAGSGPTVFAWVDGDAAVPAVKTAMTAAFQAAGAACTAFDGRVATEGAAVVTP